MHGASGDGYGLYGSSYVFGLGPKQFLFGLVIKWKTKPRIGEKCARVELKDYITNLMLGLDCDQVNRMFASASSLAQ